ncbi:hypothetical protein BDN70DRAFT_896402 [Pholiota conissans]|uniref:Zn(2)-C6 fungal-type domain-containing protein n=1 Tax=Pholiota conissans TaxID=109636 RepID=A0A9P6CZE9_9AGAR|nr:hypothetical protein BDN70DRAFT_896402 [Pholiota conissans]
MISDAPKGSKHVPKSSHRPLKRGKACMSCRFLKIKCDGEKPVCGPCLAHPRDDDCEYADGPGRSRTRALEDTVSRLEARLAELENPEGSTPSVLLHHPYLYNAPSKSPPIADSPVPLAPLPLSPFSPTSTSSSLPSGMPWNPPVAKKSNTELSGSSGSSTSPVRFSIPMPYLGAEELTLTALQASLDQFLPHAQQFGFFMHVPTFRHSSLLAFPLGHHSRPTTGLVNVVHLMGIHLSQPESLQGAEALLLTKAVQTVSVDLLSTHPNKVMNTLQAEIVLAYYFLRTGFLLEAKVHTATAVALALGAGLHKLRSTNMTTPSILGLVHDQPYVLTTPVDVTQEAERINGFWTVLTLHKFITVALEPPAHVCGALEASGIQIDTPWPVDLDRLDECLRPDLRGNSTVRHFLNGRDRADNDPPLALLTKASILFHRAAHLTGQWSPRLTGPEQKAYDSAARAVNALIESLRNTLSAFAPINTLHTRNPNTRTILLIHALVDAAAIKLHWIFAYAYPESKQICLTAARNIVNLYGDLNLQEIGHMNPIMGNLWMTACLIFVDEISRTRQVKEAVWAGSSVEDELLESYRNGLKVLSLFSQDSALMRYQLTKVQEAFEAI